MIIAVNVSKTVPRGTQVNHPSILPHAAGHWMLDKGSGKGLLKAQDIKYLYVVAVRDGKPIGYYEKGLASPSTTQSGRVVFNLVPLSYPSSITNKIDKYLIGVNQKYFVHKFIP